MYMACRFNNNLTGDYGLGAQLGYSGQYLNVYYDSGVVLGFEVDYTGGFDISEDFFVGRFGGDEFCCLFSTVHIFISGFCRCCKRTNSTIDAK